MRVAVLVPMVTELKPLVRAGHLGEGRRRGLTVHQGLVGDTEVVAAIAGIGTGPARRSTERLLDVFAADHVVVCGIAGGFDGACTIGDLVVPATVVDQADGRAYTATPLGPIAPGGTLVTTGDLVDDPVALAAIGTEGYSAIDMETAAIAAVCDERGLPWTAFRGISDMAGDGLDESVLGLVNADGSYRPAAAARFVLTSPWRIPELMRLGRGLNRAATAAAEATLAACRAGTSPARG